MTSDGDVAAVGRILVDSQQELPARFRALFTLRNLGGAEAVRWISETFSDESALLKHELAYCLGQMQDERAIPILETVLRDRKQEPMVRHEAGERSSWSIWLIFNDLLAQNTRRSYLTCELSMVVGEALGAIGNPKVLELLKQYSKDPVIEVPQNTCK